MLQYATASLFLLAMLSSTVGYNQGTTTLIPEPRNNNEKLRHYDSQRFNRYIFSETGSGTYMPGMSYEESQLITEGIIEKRQGDIAIRPVEIELVFHILHTRDPEVAAVQVASQIEALNRDFNNKSLEARHPNDPEGKYLILAEGAQITFKAADDEATSRFGNGIATLSRIEKEWTFWDDMKSPEGDGVKAIAPSKYLNIWVTDLPRNIGSYASNTYYSGPNDGIVIDAQYFGEQPDAEHPYTQGKTLTHLIGNYLGLLDLWDATEKCKDDYVDDTPIHNAANEDIYAHRHSSTCPGYPAEMTMNFMDSTPDKTQMMFTKGQVRRMHAVLHAIRPSLIGHTENSAQ